MSFHGSTRRLRALVAAGSALAALLTMPGGALAANVVNHGGPVQSNPKIYLAFWGIQWQIGWTDVSAGGRTYTSVEGAQYITDFFQDAGQYFAPLRQYGGGIPTVAGVWHDSTSPPPPPGYVPDNCLVVTCVIPDGSVVDAAFLIGQEAVRAEAHFGGYVPQANYVILLPKLSWPPGYGVLTCGYHSEAVDPSGHRIAYTALPYESDSGTLCGQNSVNADSPYGNGFFDGYSIIAGALEADVITDPYPLSAPAWTDPSGAEVGDLCGFTYLYNFLGAGGRFFAVRGLWSNAAGGCV